VPPRREIPRPILFLRRGGQEGGTQGTSLDACSTVASRKARMEESTTHGRDWNSTSPAVYVLRWRLLNLAAVPRPNETLAPYVHDPSSLDWMNEGREGLYPCGHAPPQEAAGRELAADFDVTVTVSSRVQVRCACDGLASPARNPRRRWVRRCARGNYGFGDSDGTIQRTRSAEETDLVIGSRGVSERRAHQSLVERAHVSAPSP
jgi:hypothetical protein